MGRRLILFSRSIPQVVAPLLLAAVPPTLRVSSPLSHHHHPPVSAPTSPRSSSRSSRTSNFVAVCPFVKTIDTPHNTQRLAHLTPDPGGRRERKEREERQRGARNFVGPKLVALPLSQPNTSTKAMSDDEERGGGGGGAAEEDINLPKATVAKLVDRKSVV